MNLVAIINAFKLFLCL